MKVEGIRGYYGILLREYVHDFLETVKDKGCILAAGKEDCDSTYWISYHFEMLGRGGVPREIRVCSEAKADCICCEDGPEVTHYIHEE